MLLAFSVYLVLFIGLSLIGWCWVHATQKACLDISSTGLPASVIPGAVQFCKPHDYSSIVSWWFGINIILTAWGIILIANSLRKIYKSKKDTQEIDNEYMFHNLDSHKF